MVKKKKTPLFTSYYTTVHTIKETVTISNFTSSNDWHLCSDSSFFWTCSKNMTYKHKVKLFWHLYGCNVSKHRWLGAKPLRSCCFLLSPHFFPQGKMGTNDILLEVTRWWTRVSQGLQYLLVIPCGLWCPVGQQNPAFLTYHGIPNPDGYNKRLWDERLSKHDFNRMYIALLQKWRSTQDCINL